MTTDSATAGPAATGASPAGAVPGPFPPVATGARAGGAPGAVPGAAPAPYILALDEGATNAKAHAIAPDWVHPRLRLRRRRRLPPPPRLGGAGRRGRLGGPDGGHPRLPGGRGRPPASTAISNQRESVVV